MVEIALCLAIIGFALVAIIGILPLGMDVQKENRQETIILQDASIWMNAIRNGERGIDDLTNYVISITVCRSTCENVDGSPLGNPTIQPYGSFRNGGEIVGLLSTPKYMPIAGNDSQHYSNYVYAIVRSMSGPANEKFPQGNPDVLSLGLKYKLISEVVPCFFGQAGLWTNEASLHEIRLLFRYPYNPVRATNGPGRQVFRSTTGGRLLTGTDPYFFIEPRAY
jgi:hypothetical protein